MRSAGRSASSSRGTREKLIKETHSLDLVEVGALDEALVEQEGVVVDDIDKVWARRRPGSARELLLLGGVPEAHLVHAAMRGARSAAALAGPQDGKGGARSKNAPNTLVDHALGERRLALLVVNATNVAEDLQTRSTESVQRHKSREGGSERTSSVRGCRPSARPASVVVGRLSMCRTLNP